jgi:hypothetical protein
MDRREVLKRVAILTGATVIGGEIFLLSGCKSESITDKNNSQPALSFTKEQINLIQEIANIILPAPEGSIGAKDINMGSFISMMVNDCYQPKDQKIFINGINKITTSFSKITPEKKSTLLIEIDKEARAYNKTKKNDDPTHYFTMLRQLTILGFATSKEGASQVFNWVPVPGKFDGNFKYKKGDRPFIS